MRRIECGFLSLLAVLAFGVVLYAFWYERDSQPAPEGSGLTPVPSDDVHQALQAEMDRTHERIAAKHRVVRELLAERLTLRQAAARFQELDAAIPEKHRAHWRANCPGATDEERYCWTVLRFVGTQVQNRPALAYAVRQRLEAELPDNLGRLLPDSRPFPEF
jgi:hypothetical protein